MAFVSDYFCFYSCFFIYAFSAQPFFSERTCLVKCSSAKSRRKALYAMSDGVDARSLPEYRVFAGDTHGRLFRLYAGSQRLEPVEFSGVRYGPATACQELVTGQVEDATGKASRLVCLTRALSFV